MNPNGAERLPPQPARIYQNFIIDNTRWCTVGLRDDDILICSIPKSGTTWTQMIVALLVFQRTPLPAALDTLSPWIERRTADPVALRVALAAQRHRRFLKSHMPFDGIPSLPDHKKIFVARDPRDMTLSLWNHHRRFKADVIERMNTQPGRVGPPVPAMPARFDEFFRTWMTRGWFDGETEGYPTVSPLRSALTWWAQRDADDVLLVHYGDLMNDLAGEMRRIAAFIGIEVPDRLWPSLVEAAGFDAMKRGASELVPFMGRMFRGGPQDFIHRGGGGRWRGLLSQSDLTAYDRLVARRLPPDCARWLEHGRHDR